LFFRLPFLRSGVITNVSEDSRQQVL